MSTTYIINGFLYAIMQGADVINMSLGMRWPDFVKMLSLQEQQELARTMYPEEAQFWDEMYAYAEDYNVVVVQAAGNDDVLSSIDPMKRSEKTIVVGASDAHNAKSGFSNYGNRTDVSAPGSAVYSALPGNQYGLMDGTSMSSPIVAGAAGLLRSANENLSCSEVKNILIKTGIAVQTDTDKPMGPLIQLDKAIALAKTTSPSKDCKQTVDSLLKVIDGLQKQLKAKGTK
jgi:subtilisin family serine protease